ncbi:MAG TPA: hypothetical protein PK092_05800 [Chitinophagaceae bacterium]|nr:hypothetical protein [Chitinophagaceae bacterium]
MRYLSYITIVLIAVLVACSNKKRTNYFSGQISYTYSYTSDSLNTDSISAIRPSQGVFWYDTSNYQSRFIGADTFTYYYSGKLNKCLFEPGSSKEYECEDYSKETDSVVYVKDYPTDEKILGYPCRILELQKKSSWVKYYYATDLQIAPATYKNHKAYNWDVYGIKTNGGLILKLEHRFNKFVMHGLANSISIKKDDFKALEINESLFSEICK